MRCGRNKTIRNITRKFTRMTTIYKTTYLASSESDTMYFDQDMKDLIARNFSMQKSGK